VLAQGFADRQVFPGNAQRHFSLSPSVAFETREAGAFASKLPPGLFKRRISISRTKT
jgi:hypothetical protein